MKVGIHIDRSVEEIEVLITAQERNRKVDALYQHIVEFDKSRLETLTAYRDDIAKIVNVADIFRIYTGNQKVYIQTHQGEYVIRYRLYELNEALDKKQFLRISNSEIVNVKKIRDIDLSIIGRICIRFEDNSLGFMIIFGKDERVKFEEIRETLSDPVCRQYDEATTYRDGKWVMFEPTDTYEFDDYMKLLAIKRKPNRK